MDYLQILFVIIIGVALVAAGYIITKQPERGNSVIAATLCGLFSGYTAVQLYAEGPVMFFTNHSGNLTGIQVWWDIVMAVIIALFFIVPRAKAQGMNIPLWSLFVLSTASIGILAMCARLFWLENKADTSPAAA